MRVLHIANPLLAEGACYAFTIMNTITLDDEMQDKWFVLRDPSGYKLLMPARYYQSYGFIKGQTIRCRVDRINCNGRIFLEPEHPYYIEGNTYPFDVVSASLREEKAGVSTCILHVRDVLGNIWEVRTSRSEGLQDLPSSIICRLDRIKKGRLFLTIMGDLAVKPPCKPGDHIRLTVSGTAHDPDDGQPCYMLSHATGYCFLLKKKHFAKYGWKIGAVVSCTVHDNVYGSLLHVEPEHPKYVAGQSYYFDIACIERQVFADGSIQNMLVVYDCFGEEVKVHIAGEDIPEYEGRKQVKARVAAILKSRPQLVLHAR